MRHATMLWVPAALAAIVLTLPAEAQTTGYPYVTRVTGDSVNVRAGPGPWWYVTGKLQRDDRVTVVGSLLGWVEIRPPADQLSLVLKDHVIVDGQTGIIKGDAPVPVRASPSGERRVNRIQVMLPPGTKVAIRDSWGPYFRVAPPEGATVFVAASYLAEPGIAVGSAGLTREPPVPAPTPTGTTERIRPAGEETVATPSTTTAVRPTGTTQPDLAEQERKKFEELKATVETYRKLLKDELDKPLAERDYAGTLAKFEGLKTKAEQDRSEGLGQYADAVIVYLKQQVAVQRLATAQPGTMARIVQEADRIASAPPPSRQTEPYQATGVLRRSSAFQDSSAMPNLYKLESPDGQKVLCYLQPADGAMDLSSLLDRSVRVSGKRQYRPDWNFYVVHADRIEPAGVTDVEPPTPTPTPTPTPSTTVVEEPVAPRPRPPVSLPPPEPDEELIFGPRFEGPPGEVLSPPATQPAAPPGGARRKEPAGEPEAVS